MTRNTPSSQHPLWDSLSTAEFDATVVAVRALTRVSWAQPLLAHAKARHSLPEQLHQSNQCSAENRSDLFEMRFAAELTRAEREFQYEFAAGVGNSTIDLRVPGEPDWLIELVCLRTTEAVKTSTVEVDRGDGVTTYSHILLSGASDPKNTEEYEMLAAIGKIREKAYTGGCPTKFPPPARSFHAVLVDARGYLGRDGGDSIDYIQISAGAGALRGEDRMLAKALPGTRKPIRGLFEPGNPHPGAQCFKERVHFVGFVTETTFEPGEIGKGLLLVNNMNLFSGSRQLQRAVGTFPLPGGHYYPVLLRGEDQGA